MIQQILEGKVIFVIGGAGGLGEAICRVLHEQGCIVVIADIVEKKANALAAELDGEGGETQAMAVDICDEMQVKAAIDSVVSRYGRLDALINNAAIDKTVSIEDLSLMDWDRIMATNLRGPFLLSQCSLPVMKQQNEGHIVNIVSTASKRAWPNAAAYHASKSRRFRWGP